MCGIICVLDSGADPKQLRRKVVGLARRIKHRGPDWSGICVQRFGKKGRLLTSILEHERLSIVDPEAGDQPIYNEDGTIAAVANGEIYNHRYLRETYLSHKKLKSHSDSEVIPHLWELKGDEFVDLLDGMFAFVASNSKTGDFIAARDHIGIIPLYVGYGSDGSMWFSSEMKALHDHCVRYEEFPPGHYYSSRIGTFKRWYNAPWVSEKVPTAPLDLKALREAFENSVAKLLMSDVPYGVLLSGGLDSSLVAAVASRHSGDHNGLNPDDALWFRKLHSFSVGLPGAPDLIAAKQVADFLGTVHHEFHFTVEDGIDALEDVIYHLETYDVTTIRASTPMYFLSRKIKALGVKMVLSGEGSDEIFGGYLYFHKAPSKEKFHVETCHKLKALSKYDCNRANKSTMAWGLEARVPFLDRVFLDTAMGIDPEEKMIKNGRMEKWIMRKAFDTPENPYLPDSILWRQKEQFSDGVGYSWIDSLKKYAEGEVSDEEFANASTRFPINTPMTKEAYFYRTIFEKFYPGYYAAKTVPGGPSIACSTPAAIEWEKSWKDNLDPSGRAVLGVHTQATKQSRFRSPALNIHDGSQ